MSTAPWIDRRLSNPFPLLMSTSLVMLVIGLVMILSASSVAAFQIHGSSFWFFNRQVLGTILGVAVMLVFAGFDHKKLRLLAAPLMLVSIALLVAVLIPGVGKTAGGSSRWLPLGPFRIQPSELAKLALVLFTANTLERKGKRIADFKELMLPVFACLGLVCLLIMAQPDLGTTLVCAATVLVIVYLAGARPKHLLLLGAGGILLTLGLIMGEGYRRARLFSFLDPWADPLNTGYQTIQGQIALGSGGFFGLGLGASRQKWSYVPNAHTDFIFAILGEELGLLGTLFTVALFAFFIYLAVRIARKAQDRFGFLVAGGITGWIGVQALINMGAVTGILPITGVPLPLISFGGSSLLFTMAAIGILLSIARSRRS